MDDMVPEVCRFEEFVLDTRRRTLHGGNGPVELRPRSFEVLCHLVVRHGVPVSKSELMDTLWPDVVVTEESLTRCISDVRQALGDDQKRIIKTLPRRGYLFAAPVIWQRAAAPPVAAPAAIADSTGLAARPEAVSQGGSRYRWTLLAAVVALAVAALGGW